MTDAYWTDERRADPRALSFEPYRVHKIYEIVADDGYRYRVRDHPGEWPTASAARLAIDRCVDVGDYPTGRIHGQEAGDPFARFGGPLYG